MNQPDPRRRVTLGDVLLHNARVRPNDEAVTDGTARMSWQELSHRAESACAQMLLLGVQPGDRVAVVLPNQIETLVLYWACALWGLIFVGANPRLGHDELRAILEHCEPAIAFIAESIDPSDVPSGTRTVVVSERSDPGDFFTVDAPMLRDDLPPVEPTDVFAIVYTSGTTGAPKGAVLTHHNILWAANVTAERLAIDSRDVFLLAVQITHIFGLSAGVLVAALRGARCVLMREHTAGRALDFCEWEGITIHHGTPTMFLLELAAQRRAPRDLSTLRTGIIGAAPIDPDTIEEIRRELHCNVDIAWGLTETSATVTLTRPDDPPYVRSHTVGRPVPGAELRFADVGGEYAEILARSPGVLREYYREAERTRQAVTEDGFFRTGDLGWLDESGYLHLAGRLKDVIIRGGLHVYPDELEAILRELPWIEEVAVVGLADHVLGERTCVCVVLNRHVAPPSEPLAAIRGVLTGRLADYKQPDVLLTVEEIPRSAGGKVLKRVLREHAITKLPAH